MTRELWAVMGMSEEGFMKSIWDKVPSRGNEEMLMVNAPGLDIDRWRKMLGTAVEITC